MTNRVAGFTCLHALCKHTSAVTGMVLMEGDQGPLLVSGRGKVEWRGGTECSYKRTYIRMYVHMYVCMYVRAYVCVYVCTYVRMYVCAYVHLLSPTDLCGIYCTHSLGSVYLLLSSLY